MSRYYQGYQPQQRRQQDFTEIERMRLEQQQGQQQGQSQDSNMNGIGRLAKYFNTPSSAAGLDSLGGASSNYVNSSGGISTAMQSPAPVTDFATGATMNPVNSGATSNALGSMGNGGSWYSNLFSGGEGATGGSGMSAAAAPVAAVLALNTAHNKGISNWGDAPKGKFSGNMLDYYQGDQDGKEHGFMSKIFDPDGATGQLSKSATDFLTLDFSNGLDSAKDGLKNLFKLKLF
jgi:hypothetical protein